MKAALALITIGTATLLTLVCAWSGAGSIPGNQPVLTYFMDETGRILRRRHLRDGPNARWVSLAGQRTRFVSLRWRPQCSLATACGSPFPLPRALQPARHARRNSLDWDLCRPFELEWQKTDPVSRDWRSIHNIAARRPRGNGVGRHDYARSETAKCSATGRMARLARSCGVWVRTVQALSGSARSLVSGDGSLVLQSATRQKHELVPW
jgi:hypothetical protein